MANIELESDRKRWRREVLPGKDRMKCKWSFGSDKSCCWSLIDLQAPLEEDHYEVLSISVLIRVMLDFCCILGETNRCRSPPFSDSRIEPASAECELKEKEWDVLLLYAAFCVCCCLALVPWCCVFVSWSFSVVILSFCLFVMCNFSHVFDLCLILCICGFDAICLWMYTPNGPCTPEMTNHRPRLTETSFNQ